MARYKVAQDVEADDKLLGPFGFRQFIYLVIVAMAGFIGYGLWRVFPPLAIFPLPVIILFGALALPLRKDQPMETYLAAMVSFYLKPRRRLWQPDGIEHIIEITAPKTMEENLTKAIGGSEADRRLAYLADLADSRGWSIRHAPMPGTSTSMVGDVYNEAQATQDMLDESGGLVQNIDSLISRADAAHREKVMSQMRNPAPAPVVDKMTYAFPANQPAADDGIDASSLRFNPYPNIHQSVIQPISDQPTPAPTQQPEPTTAQQSTPQPQPVAAPVPTPAPEPDPEPVTEPETTSDMYVDPDIINLANNSKNLSVETLAHEASKLRKKKHDDDEVVIQLH